MHTPVVVVPLVVGEQPRTSAKDEPLAEPGEVWPAGPDAPDALAFNGPYMLTEYVPQDHATLAANPNLARVSLAMRLPSLQQLL